MDYLDQLVEQFRNDGKCIVLYPEWSRAKIASELAKRYPEYMASEYNGFGLSVEITKRKRAFVKTAPLDKDAAQKLLHEVDAVMARKKEKSPNADQWKHVHIGAECGYLYDVIDYLDSISEYNVTKSRYNHGISFVLKNKKGVYKKYVFANMGVGDYYTLGDDDKISSVRAYASAVAKTLGIKLKVSAKERKVYRVA